MRLGPTERRSLAVALALACGVLALAHLVVVWVVPGMPGTRVLLDTDAYMWMNRVIHMAETGDWFDHSYPRINPPEGHEQHWTRPFDALLLTGGTVFGWIWGFREGLYFWGVILPPVLHLLTLIALMWAAQPLLRRGIMKSEDIPLLFLVFLVQVPVYSSFLVGRPDHHALLGVLFVGYLGFWMRVLLDERNGLRSAVGLGLVAALAIWVNVEALIFVTLGMTGLGLSWLFGNHAIGARAAVHGLALVVGTATAMAVEWGPRAPWIREMDTLSVAHLGLLTLAGGFWCLLWWVSGKGVADRVSGRAVVCAVGAIAVMGGLYAVLPEFFASPLEGIDPLYAETRLALIRELQPLSALGKGFLGGVGVVVLFVGAGMISVPYLVIRAFQTGDCEERIVWIVFALALSLYLGMALDQRRWADYAGLATVVPFTLLCVDVLRKVAERTSPIRLRIVRPLVLVGLLVGPLLLGGGLAVLARSAEDVEEAREREAHWWGESPTEPAIELPDRNGQEDCDLVEVAEVLAAETLEAFQDPQLVLAHTDHGPELLFRTHHSVLSIPNHRPQPGYTFMHEVMSHPRPDEASRRLRDRGVGVIVLCRQDVMSGFFRYPDQGAFGHWLAEGGVPEGFVLHAVSPAVRVYRVRD